MPCRAAPPPPPPPHATQELTSSPTALSNPLVYRLRTCCLQEFLPRISLAQHSPIPIRGTQTDSSSCSCSCSTTTDTDGNTNCSCSSTPACIAPTRRPRSSPTQLSALFNNHGKQLDTPSFFSSPPPLIDVDHAGDSDNVPLDYDLQKHTASISLSGWQPSSSNIQLTQLEADLASRFMRWALSEKVLTLDSWIEANPMPAPPTPALEQPQEELKSQGAVDQTQSDHAHHHHHSLLLPTTTMPSIDTLDAACRDWTAAHDLIWPDGDYYIARKTIIREGVAHLKRGRRYIFVEPVLGPATSYLYPRWEDENEVVDDDMDENYEGVHEVLSTQENNYNNSNSYSNGEVGQHRPEGNDAPVVSTDAINTTDTDTRSLSFTAQALASGQSDAAHVQADVNPRFMNEQEHTPGVNETEATPATDGDGTRGDRAHLCPAMGDKGERIEKDEADDSNSRVDSNTNGSNTNSANSTPNTHTNNNISTPSPPSSSSSPSTSNTRSSTSGHANDSQPLRHPHQQQQQQPQHSRPFESLEPYSPLLDPSTDGQDQFEYGLYELQYIPKIQYLLPEQFLPTRRSFIVHLDEDRPTLASPVPAHWRRSECRCQLMMRKVLLHRDLLQVWPPIPPVRTLQERQQEAEEEARMLEIKQKVQLQSVNWRKTLMTQMVACG